MAAQIVGSGLVVSNANIRVATGDGHFFGTVSVIYLPASATGTFDGRFRGSLTGWISVTGKGLSHGTGDARGLKLKLTFESEPPPPWLVAVLPTTCPTDKPLVGIIRNTGHLHDRHGG